MSPSQHAQEYAETTRPDSPAALPGSAATGSETGCPGTGINAYHHAWETGGYPPGTVPQITAHQLVPYDARQAIDQAV